MPISMGNMRRTHVLLRIMSGKKTESTTDVLRLPKKHRPKADRALTADDARRLIEAQSVRNAIVASVIVIVVFSALWVMLTALVGSFYAWLSLLLGVVVGMAVRRAGLGLDWRFPVIAAVFAFLGSLAGTVVVAASNAAPELNTSTLDVLTSMTVMTWEDFFANNMTPAHWIMAGVSAALAAFYATRKLTREEVLALRMYGDRPDA